MVIQQEVGCNSQLKGRGHRKEKGNGDNHDEGEWRKENLQGYREVHSECDGLSTEDDRREGGKKTGYQIYQYHLSYCTFGKGCNRFLYSAYSIQERWMESVHQGQENHFLWLQVRNDEKTGCRQIVKCKME